MRNFGAFRHFLTFLGFPGNVIEKFETMRDKSENAIIRASGYEC